jgi:limonene 1,2-monooxygenase
MVPQRLDFGIFMAPFHKAGDNATLALRRDIELIQRLDELGYDEVWAGEHHSGGWETSASPQVFLAAVGEDSPTDPAGSGRGFPPVRMMLKAAGTVILEAEDWRLP